MALGRTFPSGSKPPSEIRILVVDDDRCIRETLSSVLETDGYRVELAENGQIALNVVRRDPKPDLMLLDLMMPVLSGWELLEMLEEGDRDLGSVPILVISAMSAPLSGGRAGGVRGCFSKPIDIDVLLDAVKTHIASLSPDRPLPGPIAAAVARHAHRPGR